MENRRFENQNLLQENRLPGRTWIIPAQKEDVFYYNKEESDRVQSLNGEWDFFFAPHEEDVPENFFAKEEFEQPWDKLPVPGMWQYYGYGTPRYVNVDYPFPFNPPFVGRENPIGCYRTRFTVKEHPGQRIILHFAGVDSMLELWINGNWVGMSKGSRLPAEFDITGLVREGENLLAAKVTTYCDGSYLENQDMWMLSGIFRDVYLLYQNEIAVWDYEIKTTMDSIEMTVIPTQTDETTTLWIEVAGQRREISLNEPILSAQFAIEQPNLWNAEEPNLYKVCFGLEKYGQITEIHTKMVGLREVEISEGYLKVNKTPIQFQGANRHEYRPDKGRAISVEDIEEDLRTLKNFNFNAIRCSHYTNHPAFYELCNKYGFYVVDEADLESHGCGNTGDQGFLSKRESWYPAYHDRVERMYLCDRNETCIVIWSIGNECGSGGNLRKCSEWLRQQNIAKPILQAQDETMEYSDFRQCGYRKFINFQTMAMEEDPHPAIATEYAHGMGNGPGQLEELWELFDNYPHFQGGFVWEFRNHGFLQKTVEGQEYYAYGGDFGEDRSCANFLLDGFFFSDGRPKPQAYEIQHLMAPVKAVWQDGILKIHNRKSFATLRDLRIRWSVLEDFLEISCGEENISCLTAGKWVSISPKIVPPEQKKAGAVYRLNVEFYEDDKFLKKQQFELCRQPKAEVFTVPNGEISVEENGGAVLVSGENFRVCFRNGVPEELQKDGKNLLSAPMRFNFYRSNTDNDGITRRIGRRGYREIWDNSCLNLLHFEEEEHEIIPLDGKVQVVFRGKILPEGAFLGFFTEVTYTVASDGSVLMKMEGEPYGRLPEVLPRIGVELELPKCYDRVEWYGRGWRENYADRKASTPVGFYQATVAESSVMYERPQENGARCNTAFVAVTNEQRQGLLAIAMPECSFSVHDYTQKNLVDAEHLYELKKCDRTYLYLDYAMRGLGSRSCGPDPEEEYELRPHAFTYAFLLTTYEGEKKALELWRKEFGVENLRRSENYVAEINEEVRQNFDCR